MASLEECRAALQELLAKLDGIDPNARRNNVPDRTIELVLLDLDAYFSGRWRDGELCDMVDGPCPTRPNVRLAMSSDDLLDLTSGRLSFAHAWATGRIRLDASLRDLLRLRKML